MSLSRRVVIWRDNIFQNGLMRFTTAALNVMSKEKGGKGGVIVNTASCSCKLHVRFLRMHMRIYCFPVSLSPCVVTWWSAWLDVEHQYGEVTARLLIIKWSSVVVTAVTIPLLTFKIVCYVYTSVYGWDHCQRGTGVNCDYLLGKCSFSQRSWPVRQCDRP